MSNLLVGSLVGVDGNAFSLMGYYSKQARRQGVDKAVRDSVLADAQSGDYDHLVSVLAGQFE